MFDLNFVHSGAGGVGQAAINVCQSMGCKVYTTCSDSKRDFLKSTFGLTDDQIFNSRSDTFDQDILQVTNGHGVDVILNSLSEKKLKASINCLADFGRFVEIGKYDILTNSTLDMSTFGGNKSLQTTCLAHLDVDAIVNQNPSAIVTRKAVYDLVAQGIKTGVVKPMKRHVYHHDQIEHAFRFMASGKHIGKVVIKIKDEGITSPVTVSAIRQTIFHPQQSYIITGGLGGFGLELASWMLLRGAKHLILSSRTGVKDVYQEISLRRMREGSFGAQIEVSTADVTTKDGVEAVLKQAKSMGPVGGIFNLAMVLRDATLENQTVESFEECCRPKVDSTLLLDQATRTSCPQLEYFVCFSSVVSGRGNPGQTNYGYANSAMERVCEERRRDNLPGLAIQWGAIGDVGIVAEVLGGNDVVIGGTSIPQRVPSCLDTLDTFLLCPHPVVSSIVKVNTRKSGSGSKGDILGTICHILGIKDPSSLDPNSTLNELGMDSLMAIEIKQGLERDYDILMSSQEIRNMRVRDLKEMGTLTKTKKSPSSASLGSSEQVTLQEIVTLSKGNFTQLNNVQTGKAIFVFPPIEGTFRSLLPLFKHVNRPVIGINWTEECDKMKSFKDLVAYFVHTLKQNYPDNQHDIIGYDFGSLLAIETSIALQKAAGESAVKKLGLIDSSPDLMRAAATELLNRSKASPIDGLSEEESTYNHLLIEFFSIFFPLEPEEKSHLEEDLIALKSDRAEKLTKVSSLITAKLRDSQKSTDDTSDEVCTPSDLQLAMDRFHTKVKMCSTFELTSKKIPLTLGLFRCTDSLPGGDQMDPSYNLSKVIHSFICCFSN